MISAGNSKLGKIPNVSLTPIKSCPNGIPCAKDCYACKHAYNLYPSVRLLWDKNLYILRQGGVDEFFNRLYSEFKPCKFFRIHVGGDFFSQEYLDGWKQFARKHPETIFLAFTKAHALNYSNLPSNLKIVFSMWPGFGDTKKQRPRAWMRDSNNLDNRIPMDAIECPGSCDTCGMCWQLDKLGKDVVFDKH
jgi:hypothetical protein